MAIIFDSIALVHTSEEESQLDAPAELAEKEQVFLAGCVTTTSLETDGDSREGASAMYGLTHHKGRNPELWWLRHLDQNMQQRPLTLG